MKEKILLDEGYKRHIQEEKGKILYQKKFSDNKGIQYFINCYRYELSVQNEILIKWEWDIQISTPHGTINTKLFETDLTIEEIEKFMFDLWFHYGKIYYEEFVKKQKEVVNSGNDVLEENQKKEQEVKQNE
jgi:hypothetical protein